MKRFATLFFLPSYFLLAVLPSRSCIHIHAWSPPGISTRTNHGISRREAISQAIIATTATATILAINPLPAHADVTNKIASVTALRFLTRAQTKLPAKLLPSAQSNNYLGVKSCLREPPFDELRKNMLILVRGGEDGPKADDLTLAYKELIKTLETIDATASLGMRGGKSGAAVVADPFRLGTEYGAIEKALDAFIKVGTEAASIPMKS